MNRNPEDYGDANHQSHVLVALRHNKDSSNNKKYKSGNVIAYVICEVSRDFLRNIFYHLNKNRNDMRLKGRHH